MMHLKESEIGLRPDVQNYISDALDVVFTKFVDDASAIDAVKSYPVEFAYQQFNDSEKIVGYKNLRVTLIYSNLTMYSYLKIDHDGLITEIKDDFEPDNIRKKILQLYPIDQQDCLIGDWPTFAEVCKRQSEFKPFGERISTFVFSNRKFQMYKVSKNTPEFDSYMCRIQTLTMWFIEGAQYTDNNDPRFMHYLLYEEVYDSKVNPLKLAGYMTLYRFYAYPDKERARFAHVLILPFYRNIGLAPTFLGQVFNDIRNCQNIIDTTAEDPADAFIFARDYADCLICKSLPEFSLENMKGGYNKDLAEIVQKKVKICKKQCRRVFEIIYWYYVKTVCPEEKSKFERMLFKRLELPFKQSKRDVRKMSSALEGRELAVIATNADDREQQIHKMVEHTIQCYETVITRLIKHEPQF